VDAADLLDEATHLLNSVPPDDLGDPVLDVHGVDIAQRVRARRLQWAGYLSTTGVYGDRGGALVDETAALTPAGERGRRRVRAEESWRALHIEHGLPLHIFRLAGIYGPGRSAIDALRAGTARRIRKPGHVFSRIHVDDVVTVLRASMARPEPGAIYNVCDDDPTPSEEVVAYAAELLGLAPPALIDFEAADLSAMARSFYADNKRVSNRRLKERLGVTLRYPSYRDGLKALASDR
jgi:nucleoside-diphosphate-sugar epimerase